MGWPGRGGRRGVFDPEGKNGGDGEGEKSAVPRRRQEVGKVQGFTDVVDLTGVELGPGQGLVFGEGVEVAYVREGLTSGIVYGLGGAELESSAVIAIEFLCAAPARARCGVMIGYDQEFVGVVNNIRVCKGSAWPTSSGWRWFDIWDVHAVPAVRVGAGTVAGRNLLQIVFDTPSGPDQASTEQVVIRAVVRAPKGYGPGPKWLAHVRVWFSSEDVFVVKVRARPIVSCETKNESERHEAV